MRLLKIKVIILAMGMFYGCAPHYYFFETINTQKHISNNDILLENKKFINTHLLGNHVMINALYEIVNNSSKEILINRQSFSIQSRIYNYEVLSLYPNNQRMINSSNKIETNSSIHLSPYDSVSISVYYYLDKKIKEKQFVKERLQDTVINSINVNGNDYIYTFKPIEDTFNSQR